MPRTFSNPIRSHRVVDGDTVQVELDLGYHVRMDVTLRLEGIDTPEMHSEQRKAGEVAKAALIRWLKEHEAGDLLCVSEKLDGYGRSIGDIRQNGVSIGASLWMYHEGYAVLIDRKRHNWTREELAAIEAKAGVSSKARRNK